MLSGEIVKQVRRIQVTTGRQVADVLPGAYSSVFKGRGVEFDEVRPYVPGDDVRSIDWNVTARMGEPFIKRYVEERQLTVLMLVDLSASQDFGSDRRSKRDAAVELSALIAFSAINNDDKVGLLLFDSEVVSYIPPRKGQRHALRVVREVLAPEATSEGDAPFAWRSLAATVRERLASLVRRHRSRGEKKTDIAAALDFCRRVLPRRAVLFLVSDFLDADYIDGLRLTNRRHDVVAVRVSDRHERLMPDVGLATLGDAETGAMRLVDTGSATFRAALEEGFVSRLESQDREFARSKIDVIDIDASDDVLDPLVRFFRMRERRIRRG